MTIEIPGDQDIVIVGATGDLARRKLIPALYNLHRQNLLPRDGHVIGYARGTKTDAEFRRLVQQSVTEFSRTPIDRSTWDQFIDRFRYYSLSEHGFAPVREQHSRTGRMVYLSVPPSAFRKTVQDLGHEGLVENTRLVVEKPFGQDLQSSRDLASTIHDIFPEEQVFRIDHFLGKETVQNILFFRFGNSLFERAWNREAIDHVQITVAESLGMEGRGSFYDEVGAIRDILQNHVFQVLALLAMEPPAAFEAQSIRDEKVKVLKAMEPIRRSDVVRGRYTAGEIDGQPVPGYLHEQGVAAASTTETYAAMRVYVDNWRWAGVPFYLRTGKRLSQRTTEVHVAFREAPVRFFQSTGINELSHCHLTLNIQPRESISLTFLTKVPGSEIAVQPVTMEFAYSDSFTQPAEAYERLIHDVLRGDQTLFARSDAVDRAWEVVQPLLDDMPPVHDYPAGSWGPEEANDLIAPAAWHLH